MNNIFTYILNHSMKITCVIVLVLLVRFLFVKLLRLPRKYAYILWGIAALRMILVFSVASPLSIFNLSSVIDGSITERWMNYEANASDHNVNLAENANGDDLGIGFFENTNTGEAAHLIGKSGNPVVATADGEIADGESVDGMTADRATTDENAAAAFQRTLSIAAYIWLAGVLILCSYLLVSYCMTRKRVAAAVLLSEDVYECDNIAGPFVFGMIKPRIYLPFGLEEDALSYILMHENYHIKRKDPWVKCIAFLLASIYWFNPLVWVAFYLAMSDMEMSVDEAVLLQMGTEVRKEYCLSLLAFASGEKSVLELLGHTRSRFIVGPLAFGESGASRRIKNVLHFKKPGLWPAIVGAVIIVLIAVICLTNGSSEKSGDTPQNAGINTYISIEDTLLEHACFTMTVPEDFVGKVSYAVIVEDEAEVQENGIPLDYRIEFVLDEIKFYEDTVSRDQVVPSYGAGGTLGGIAWWTVEDLNWSATEEEKARYHTFAEAYEAYYPEHAFGFEGRLLQSDLAGTGGYCEWNPTDVQWCVDGEDTDKFYESYLHYSQELREALESFRSKAIAEGEATGDNSVAEAEGQTFEGDAAAEAEGQTFEGDAATEAVKLKDLESQEKLQQRVGLDISDSLRDNPGTKMKVGFQSVEQTFAVLDFDRDGKVEKVVLRPDEEVDTLYREGRLPLDYFVLETGEAVLRGAADNLSNGIWAFSPDGEEIVLMLYEDGPSDDPMTHFYHYEDGALQEIGTLEDDIRLREITEEGVIRARIRCRRIQSDWILQQWRINEEHQLELISQDSYPLLAGNDIELLCELPLLTEPGGEESIIVNPQTVRFIAVSSDEKWMLMETASGEQGWFGLEYQQKPYWDYLITPAGKYAGEVFEGLTQWAG